MFLFIDENGNTFNGESPYIHWIKGQLSTGLWYTLKLMFVTDSRTLQTSMLTPDSIFRFIDPRYYVESPDDLDLTTISSSQITSEGVLTAIGSQQYVHQILLVCESDNAGEFIEDLTIGPYKVRVGVDLYNENESLSINLSNRGMELPVSVQKAFLDNNIREDYTDFALVNRKFKELVSNFIDVVDNKGSYKSLYNSLKWFEWGEGTKLYEVWVNDDMFLEKELKPILSETYQDLLYTHKKTTHLSLVASLQSISDDEIDEERNPVLEDIAYQWSMNELALKVSILGAFFERYFMPIHLDLKRACVETLIYTSQIKLHPGTNNYKYHIHDDTGVVDIKMDHTVVLGNIPFVSVGKDTMFGRRVDHDYYGIQRMTPIGVDPIDTVKGCWDPDESPTYDNPRISDDIATTFVQLKGGVGVIIPIKVTVNLPEDDGLITEVLNLYSWEDGEMHLKLQPIIERRLFRSQWNEDTKQFEVSFTFNLISTKEEKISFSLALYSLSGHVWTVSSSYEVIDVSGSYLDICTVKNTYNDLTVTTNVQYTSIDQWINQIYNNYSINNKNPYERLYKYIDESPDIDDVLLTQYLPYVDANYSQYNQLVVIENPLNGTTYNTDWINGDVDNKFWIFRRAGEESFSSENNPRYIMLIAKDPGVHYTSKADFIQKLHIAFISKLNIKRLDTIYIPQLHLYESIESKPAIYSNYCFDQSALLCIIPQFKKNVHISQVSWKFKNMTTLEEIELNQPMAMPLIADDKYKLLSKGFWTVTMYYKLDGSSEVHELSRNSAFKLTQNERMTI